VETIATDTQITRPTTLVSFDNSSIHLDALRGIAALSVMISHLREVFLVDYSSLSHRSPLLAFAYFLTGLGRQWVIVFFALSGYLVGGSVLRGMRNGSWSWRKYLFSRMTRLYAVLIPALIFGGVIDWAGSHKSGAEIVYSGHSGMRSQANDVYSRLNLPTLAANALFLQTIDPGWKRKPVFPTLGSNGPLWSLSNEFWYYLAFPVLVTALSPARRFRMRALCGALLLMWSWFVGYSITGLGIVWLMGVGIVYLPRIREAQQALSKSIIALAIAILIAALASLGGGAYALGANWHRPSYDLLIGIPVAFLIWTLLNCPPTRLPAFYVWIARRLAHSSYTLYLVHMPALIYLKATFHITSAAPHWYGFAESVVVFGAVVLYAQCVYQLFEMNTDRVRRWLKPYVLDPSIAR